jgi:hypothetical protein
LCIFYTLLLEVNKKEIEKKNFFLFNFIQLILFSNNKLQLNI